MTRRHCARLGAIIVMALPLVACGPKKDPESATANEDPCYDADIAAKRTWNDETRVHVKAQVLEWGGELGAEVAQAKAEEVTNSMDRLSDDWSRMRKAVCGDHFKRKTLSAEDYQRRADCLDRLLVRQRTFLESLTAPQADVSEAMAAIGEELETCR